MCFSISIKNKGNIVSTKIVENLKEMHWEIYFYNKDNKVVHSAIKDCSYSEVLGYVRAFTEGYNLDD